MQIQKNNVNSLSSSSKVLCTNWELDLKECEILHAPYFQLKRRINQMKPDKESKLKQYISYCLGSWEEYNSTHQVSFALIETMIKTSDIFKKIHIFLCNKTLSIFISWGQDGTDQVTSVVWGQDRWIGPTF